jgi:hypothetical protein
MNEDLSAYLEERHGLASATGGVLPVTANGKCLRVGPRYLLTAEQLEFVRYARATLADIWRDSFSITCRSDTATLLPKIGRRLAELANEADAWSLGQMSHVAGETAFFVLDAASGKRTWSVRVYSTLMNALEIITGLIDDCEKHFQTGNRIQRLIDEMSLGSEVSIPN